MDFGFARALSPSEVSVDIALYKAVRGEEDKKAPRSDKGNSAMEVSLDVPLNDRSPEKRGRSASMDNTISKNIVQDLSALGHRSYAAPELLKGVHKALKIPPKNQRDDPLSGSRHNNPREREDRDRERQSRSGNPRRKALTECVSDYGMVADAFSLGATIRYVLTGVPPNMSVNDFIAMQNHPTLVIVRLIKRAFSCTRKKKEEEKSGATSAGPRKKKYKRNDELPRDASQLVRALTHWDPRKRVSVRSARLYPWIDLDSEECGEVGENSNKKKLRSPMQAGGEVIFLECSLG